MPAPGRCRLSSVEPRESDRKIGRSTGSSRVWLKSEVTRLAVLASRVPGLLVLLVSAYWTGVGTSAYLGTVYMTGGVTEPRASSLEWVVMTSVGAVGLMLIARPSHWFRSVDYVALFGAVWTLGWTALITLFFYNLEFSDPDRHCRYPSCWPGAYQPLAITASLAVACLLVVMVSTAGRRRSWRVRALIPASVYVVLNLALAGLWKDFFLPLFNAPPPW